MRATLYRTAAALATAALLLGAVFAQGETLVIAFDAADLTTADPHMVAATQDRAVADMVFNGLVRYKPGDITQFEPDIAASWEASADSKVWTFHLRDNVMCHPWGNNPGYALTADDVVYSLNRSANADTSAYAGEYADMQFAALDASTVQITLADPLTEALLLPKVADYAGGFIVCAQAAEDLGPAGFATNPVGTGAFMFAGYTPQQQVDLVANPDYFRGAPQLAGVTVRFIANVSAREAGLQTGELDIIEGLSEQPWVEKMRAQTDMAVPIFGPGEAAVLYFDTSRPPLSNVNARRAIAYCIDRDELRAVIGEDVASPLVSVVPDLLPGALTEQEVRDAGLLYETDRERAIELLQEAGGGFSTELVVSERAQYLTPMQNVQAQLAQCGIDIQLRVVDHSTMHTLIRQGSNLIVPYIAWRPNADAFLSRFFHSETTIITGEAPDTNFSHFGSTDLDGDGEVDGVDDLIEAARLSLDPVEQATYWKEAQLEILDWMGGYPLYIMGFAFAMSPDVDLGYELNSTLALYPQITETTTK